MILLSAVPVPGWRALGLISNCWNESRLITLICLFTFFIAFARSTRIFCFIYFFMKLGAGGEGTTTYISASDNSHLNILSGLLTLENIFFTFFFFLIQWQFF